MESVISLFAVKPTPQSTTSPYKKPPPPTGSAGTQPFKPRSPLPVVTPKAPDVTVHSGGETDSELPVSTRRKLEKQINGPVQQRRNSSALAMELRLSCTNPSKC